MNLKELLRGTGTAIVTPFKDDIDVDYDALAKLIDFLIIGGVNYIVTLGTTGETPTLSEDEKQEIIKFTSAQINGRVPMVVGIGGNGTRKVQEEMQQYNLYDAVAILSASPYYNKPSQQGLYEHYKALAASSPLPIILYNVPGRTGKNMEAETTIKLANEVKNIAGIKEAAGNISQCLKIMHNVPEDFLVVSGDDDLVLTQLASGFDGVISVAANCFPQQFSQMVQDALAGNIKAAFAINKKLYPAFELLFAENNPAGVKAFLTEMNIIKNNLRLPLTPLSEGYHQKVKSFLQEMN